LIARAEPVLLPKLNAMCTSRNVPGPAKSIQCLAMVIVAGDHSRVILDAAEHIIRRAVGFGFRE
jgi:hypothetical protein